MRSFVVLVAVVVSGCAGKPGKPVGTYDVTATLTDSSCGPGVGQDERAFRVEIRRDGPTGYWIGPAQVPLLGSIDEDGRFAFRTDEQLLVRAAEPALGLGPCLMDQVDLAEGLAGTSFEGTEQLFVAAAPGADCRDWIGIAPGLFAELPCEMEFSLEGQSRSDPENR